MMTRRMCLFALAGAAVVRPRVSQARVPYDQWAKDGALCCPQAEGKPGVEGGDLIDEVHVHKGLDLSQLDDVTVQMEGDTLIVRSVRADGRVRVLRHQVPRFEAFVTRRQAAAALDAAAQMVR
jgi:antitoxin component of MazEF toxin-antitoxin module